MVAGLVVTKQQAFEAANKTPEGYFVGGEYPGGHTSNGNPHEESQAQGSRPYVYYKREFIMNHELTDKYRDSLFKPLHEGQPLDWSHPTLLSLLPDPELPKALRQERQAALEVQHRHSFAPMADKFDALDIRLASIEATNAQMADQRMAIPVEGGYLIYHPATGSTDLVTVR